MKSTMFVGEKSRENPMETCLGLGLKDVELGIDISRRRGIPWAETCRGNVQKFRFEYLYVYCIMHLVRKSLL